MPPLRKAPGPKGHFLLGSLPDLNRDLLGFLQQSQETYGDIVRFRIAHTAGHIVSHPTFAEQAFITDPERIVKLGQVKPNRGLGMFTGNGLIMSYGAFWRRQRDLINPMFRPKVVEGLAESMLACGEQLVARLADHAAHRTPVDIWREAVRSALQAALATLFSAPPDEDLEEINDAVTIVLRHCFNSTKNPLMPPLSWPTAKNRRFRAAVAVIDKRVHSLIQERLASGARHEDFLGLLLDATYKDSGEKMSPTQVRNEAVTMLSAGHETSASALTWALVEISRRPEIARRIREELWEIVGDGDLRVPHLRQLKYLQAVVQETLRLCPPAPMLPRAVMRDTTINGFHIPAGSILFVAVYNIHRHKEYWRDPHDFDPDRFYQEGGMLQKHRCAYIPFGAGERFCIGSNFASVELSIFLAQVIRAFDLQLVEDAIPTEVAITMRPSGPVYMQVDKARMETRRDVVVRQN